MSLSITHTFVSPKPNTSDPTLVQPSNWNATHTLTGLTNDATQYLDGTGNFSLPAGSGGLLQSNTVTLTNTEVLALQSVAQTLVPAAGAGVVIVPVRILIEIKSAYYSTPSQIFYIGAGTLESNTVVGDFGPWSDTGDAVYLDSYFFPGTINGNASSYENQPIIGYVTDTMTQPGGTGGNVYITTWYLTYTVQ